MRLTNRILAFLLLALAVMPFGAASAAPAAGLLRGKVMTGTCTNFAAATNGSDTGSTMDCTVGGQYADYTFPLPVTVTGVYYLYNSSWNALGMELYNSTGTLLRSQNLSSTGLTGYQSVVATSNVKRVRFSLNSGRAFYYEIDLQGTVTDTIPPSTPTNVVATPASGQVALSWTASTDNFGVAGYYVYRNNTRISGLITSGTSYTATGLTNNTSYAWQVSAVDTASPTANEGTRSTAITTYYDTIPPPVPDNLHTTSVTNGGVSLSWDSVSDTVGASGLAGYNIYRNGSKVNSSPIVGTSYSATGVTSNVTHTWTVRSIDNAGNESAGSSPPVITLYDTIPPAQPMGLAAVVRLDDADLTWYPNVESDLAGYNVYLDSNLLTDELLTETTYTIDGLTPGDLYSVGVTAVDTSDNESTPAVLPISPEIPDTTPPNVPTGLSGTPGSREALLNWTANSEPDLAGYNLYRNGVKINSSLLTGTNYTDENLVNGTVYSYEMTAVDEKGNESPRSPVVMVTPDSTANPPKQLKAKQVSGGVQLTWVAPDPAPETYKIYRAGIEIAEISGSSHTYTDAVTSAGTSYQYHVSAVLDGEESAKAAASVYISTVVIDYPESGAGFTARDLLDGTMGYISLFAGFILLILSIAFAPRIKDFLFSLFGASGGNQDGTYTVRVKNPAKVRKLLNDNAKFNYAPVLGKGKRRRRGGGI